MTINLRDIFSCPFSIKQPYPLISTAVKDTCGPHGHIFERKSIETYVNKYKKCPLSERPLSVAELKSYAVFQNAVDTLHHHPEQLRTNNVDGLDAESKEAIEIATKHIEEQRAFDQQNSKPIRVSQAVLEQLSIAIKEAIIVSKENSPSSCSIV